MKVGGVLVTITLLVSLAAWAGGNAMQNEEIQLPSSCEIPFDGPGQLATIWSWGQDRPDGGKALVLTAHRQTRRLELEAPRRARWRSPTELLVEQHVWPVRNGSGSRILRMTRAGEVLEILSDREGLSDAEPSSDGERVLLQRNTERGFQGIEIRSLVGEFRLQADHPKPTSPGLGSMTPPVWSPDGSKFAVGLYVPISSKEPGRLYARIAVVARDAPGYAQLPDSSTGKESERGGEIPLFWTQEGIYVRTTEIGAGLLRCDPAGSGCTPVYAPGVHRLVLQGRQIDDRKALLLVKDFTVDPLEARAKEIHEVNLTTGEGRVLVRLPDGVFISDLDWIGEVGAP
jgi:hypothetical protein